jgi:hypothetical protein
MVVCPVCTIQNDDFAITCSSCGSYVQDRIPTLDLFAMIWLIIESPASAYKKIIMAEHKNYVLFLALFLGIAASYCLMVVQKSGNSFDNLFPLLLFGTMLGIVLCIPLFFVLTGCIHLAVKTVGGRGSFTSTYGVTGWSLVPMMFFVVFVLPLMLATLGLLLFSSNPSALQVKPTVTIVLGSIVGLLMLWSLILLVLGLSMAHRVSKLKSAIVTLGVVSALCFGIVEIYSSFNI